MANLEKLYTDYANWCRIEDRMNKKPVSYFENTGEYSGFLRTKAWYLQQIANAIEAENENNIFPVEVKKGQQI